MAGSLLSTDANGSFELGLVFDDSGFVGKGFTKWLARFVVMLARVCDMSGCDFEEYILVVLCFCFLEVEKVQVERDLE